MAGHHDQHSRRVRSPEEESNALRWGRRSLGRWWLKKRRAVWSFRRAAEKCLRAAGATRKVAATSSFTALKWEAPSKRALKRRVGWGTRLEFSVYGLV